MPSAPCPTIFFSSYTTAYPTKTAATNSALLSPNKNMNTTEIEQLQVLGFKSENDYQNHHRTLEQSKALGARQLATLSTLCGATTVVLNPLYAGTNDRFADTIIGERHADYDGIEIHGVRNIFDENDSRGTCIEVDDGNPEFFSVYAHLRSGGVECVGDMGTLDLAEKYATELQKKYGWEPH